MATQAAWVPWVRRQQKLIERRRTPRKRTREPLTLAERSGKKVPKVGLKDVNEVRLDKEARQYYRKLARKNIGREFKPILKARRMELKAARMRAGESDSAVRNMLEYAAREELANTPKGLGRYTKQARADQRASAADLRQAAPLLTASNSRANEADVLAAKAALLEAKGERRVAVAEEANRLMDRAIEDGREALKGVRGRQREEEEKINKALYKAHRQLVADLKESGMTVNSPELKLDWGAYTEFLISEHKVPEKIAAEAVSRLKRGIDTYLGKSKDRKASVRARNSRTIPLR